ncbi:UDP-glucuronosyltransferase 1-7C [Orchesella cincta]|uniref:UDP-glucuronosyltransferase n=1 Tax=Orchesella cincta TaxID=48709 RepID=A0A1D2MYE6_ORCCI|nr:UDP-glucuronosyltransferase 1-7C [Orchesella cincta]
MLMRLEYGHRPLLLRLTYQLPKIGVDMCDKILGDPKIMKHFSETNYDVIVIDALFNECAYGLAYKMKAKTIVFGTSHPLAWMADALGYPSESWWLPEVHFSFDLPLNFVNRVWATLSIFYFNTIRHLAFPKLEAVLREKLEIPDMPSIPDMMANTSLMLTNTHYSEELPRALPPNVVSVGGMNCKDKSELKPIPKEIEEFINAGGEEGFILVSFGTGANITAAPEEIQTKFFKAFENTKIRFVWKWDGKRHPSIPANVMTVSWIQQQDILAHPKIRGFITHGGLLSMHESIFHQVPMIVFPVFAEQDYNGERLQRTGRGITLEITSFTQEQLEDAIHKLLYDQSYKKNVVEVSKRFMDRPQTPLETATWWVEYVIRHEDTSFMRPLAASLTWYQRRLLDVYAFLLVILISLLYLSVKFFKFIAGIALRKLSTEAKECDINRNVKVKTN